MFTTSMIDVLLCPQCQLGDLTADCSVDGEQFVEGILTCGNCAATYEVRESIPLLKPHHERDEESWKLWQSHLDGFAARRALRKSTVEKHGSKRWSEKLNVFADFVDAPDGRMLDVGCGPGKLRKRVDPATIEYFGLDPLPVDDVTDFNFVCGVAESLPFRTDSFSSIVVRSALDHFCDLSRFFSEASRILRPEGRLYVEQAVHQGSGITGFAQNTVHWLKDIIDDVRTREQRGDAPKHMREFSRDSLAAAVEGTFQIERSRTYTPNWYTPSQVFARLKPASKGD